MITVPVEIPMLGDSRRRHWAKVVTAVDESKSTGWAFDGTFIADGGVQDVEVGAVLLLYGEKGSKANPRPLASVFRVNADRTLTAHASIEGRAWARTVRDVVVELLADETAPVARGWDPELTTYDDLALVRELERRGRSVTID